MNLQEARAIVAELALAHLHHSDPRVNLFSCADASQFRTTVHGGLRKQRCKPAVGLPPHMPQLPAGEAQVLPHRRIEGEEPPVVLHPLQVLQHPTQGSRHGIVLAPLPLRAARPIVRRALLTLALALALVRVRAARACSLPPALGSRFVV